MLGTILDSHVPERSFVYPSFTHSRKHTHTARYISLLGLFSSSFPLVKICFMSSFVKKFGTRGTTETSV